MNVLIRPAKPSDVRKISAIVEPYAARRILLNRELVSYFEAISEFFVAEVDGEVVGCGALHVLWEDLAEVRSLAVEQSHLGTGLGHGLMMALLERARHYELARVFCLTFEVDFFTSLGFSVIDGAPVTPEVYAELLRSPDDHVAEFLDLARVKPNTLGNSRMLLTL